MRSFSVLLGIIAALALITSAFAGMNPLEYKGGDLGKVIFDGKLHNDKLGPGKCVECHKMPENVPFPMKSPGMEGSAKMKLEDHVDGKFCGVCHDGKKAFDWKPGADCTKCHKK